MPSCGPLSASWSKAIAINWPGVVELTLSTVHGVSFPHLTFLTSSPYISLLNRARSGVVGNHESGHCGGPHE